MVIQDVPSDLPAVESFRWASGLLLQKQNMGLDPKKPPKLAFPHSAALKKATLPGATVFLHEFPARIFPIPEPLLRAWRWFRSQR